MIDPLFTLLTRVKADAGKATPGPWKAGRANGYENERDNIGAVIAGKDEVVIGGTFRNPDLNHIANCDPALVTALVEVAQQAPVVLGRHAPHPDYRTADDDPVGCAKCHLVASLDALRSLAEGRK